MSTEALRLEPQFPDEQGSFTEIAAEAQLAREEDLPLSAEAVTLAGQMGRISAKLDVEMQRLEDAGKAIAQVVNGINPTDQASYTELCDRLNDNKQFLDGVEAFIDPWKKLFYRPYQGVLERQKQIVGAPTVSLASGKNRRLQFEREVKAAAERETMRLQKEQREREEEQRLASAVKAEEMGLSERAVETILTQPSVAPSPVFAPQITRPQGTRKIAPNWQAELESEEDFWKWARTQREMPACIRAGMESVQVVMNREAKSHRALLGKVFPGWRGINRGGE